MTSRCWSVDNGSEMRTVNLTYANVSLRMFDIVNPFYFQIKPRHFFSIIRIQAIISLTFLEASSQLPHSFRGADGRVLGSACVFERIVLLEIRLASLMLAPACFASVQNLTITRL